MMDFCGYEWQGLQGPETHSQGVVRYPQQVKTKTWIDVEDDPNSWYMESLTESEVALLLVNFESKEIEVGDKKEIQISIPKGLASYKECDKNVLTCAYDSSKEYLESILGCKMSDSDRRWYKNHQLTTMTGLPNHATITVLQDLVSVYGIGIKKIYCRKNTSATEEQRQWQEVLGINPLGLSSRSVNNQEYIEILNPNKDPELYKAFSEQEREWGFEYTDDFYGPAVIFERMQVGTEGAVGGGHASYIGPRGSRGNWSIAIQFDRLFNITYRQEPPTIPYVETSDSKLDFWGSKTKEGITLNELLKKTTPSQGGYGGNYHKNMDEYKPYSERFDHRPSNSNWRGSGNVSEKKFCMTHKEIKEIFTSFSQEINVSSELDARERIFSGEECNRLLQEIEACTLLYCGLLCKASTEMSAEYPEKWRKDPVGMLDLWEEKEGTPVVDHIDVFMESKVSKYNTAVAIRACMSAFKNPKYSDAEYLGFPEASKTMAMCIMQILRLETELALGRKIPSTIATDSQERVSQRLDSPEIPPETELSIETPVIKPESVKPKKIKVAVAEKPKISKKKGEDT